MGALGSSSLAASVYLVYVLEILKFRRLDAMRVRRARPEATEAEIEADVAQALETGEFEAVEARERAQALVSRRRSAPRCARARSTSSSRESGCSCTSRW